MKYSNMSLPSGSIYLIEGVATIIAVIPFTIVITAGRT
jgi:hypothetical protein